MNELMEKLNKGETVTVEDYYAHSERKYFDAIKEISELLSDGNEAEAAEIITLYGDDVLFKRFNSRNLLQMFYTSFENNEILYQCILNVYTHDGYNFPKKMILKAKQLSKNIPDSIRYNDLPRTKEITVYRATASSPEQAKNEISWTTNKDVAIWFAYRYHEVNSANLPDLHVYQGTIDYDKIIAYDNDRSEFEVMQHRNVRNITEIFPTDEEIKDVFDRRQKDEP